MADWDLDMHTPERGLRFSLQRLLASVPKEDGRKAPRAMEYKANPNVKRPAPPTNNTRSPKRRKALANDPTDMDANNLEKTAGQPDGPNIQKTILSCVPAQITSL